MSTYTIYPEDDAHIRSFDATYANARAGTGSTFDVVDDASLLGCGQSYNASIPLYSVYQAFLQFDVSAVVGTILTAILNVKQVDTGNSGFDVEVWQASYTGPLPTTADWNTDYAGTTILDTLATDVTTAGWKTADIPASVPNAEALFELGLWSDDQRLGNAPTSENSEWLNYRSSETSGTTDDPYLFVTDDASTDFSLAAAVGAFILTSISASVGKSFTVSPAAASFILSGLAVIFRPGVYVAAAAGAFVHTGKATILYLKERLASLAPTTYDVRSLLRKTRSRAPRLED